MRVAVGIIRDEQSRILITKRPFHKSHGGLWEFPGGKIELNEMSHEALCREIKEEVGLEVLQHQFLGEIKYQYPDKFVELIVSLVTQFSGKPSCLEGQLDMKWLRKDQLNVKSFPEANQDIFHLIPEY